MPLRNIPVVPLVVATALFMETMDQTIITTALPAIARDLGVDPISLKLAITSYLVALAIFIPVSGWVADRLGARTTFRIALAIFMAASVGCAFAGSLIGFVGWRFVQGIGGALMTPVGRLVLVRSIPKAELVRAMQFVTVPALMGPMLGPLIGGFLATYADWRWIFFVNIPIGIAGIVLATIHFDDVKTPPRKLDRKGFLLSALALAGVVVGAALVGRSVSMPGLAVLSFAVGIAAGVLYVGHARRVSEPLLDLSLFRIASFDAGVTGGALFRVGIGAGTFLMPLMLQLAFGYDPMTSGLVTFAGALGAIAMKPATGLILNRYGFRSVLIANGALASLMVGVALLFDAATPHAVMWAALFALGLLRSLQFTSLNAISYADIDPATASRATSLASVAQQVSLSAGVALGALCLELSTLARGAAAPATVDFHVAFAVVAVVSLLSVVKLYRLPQGAGSALTARRAKPADDDAV